MAEFKSGSKAGSNQLAHRKQASSVTQAAAGYISDRAGSGTRISCRHGRARRMRRALLGTTSVAGLGLALALPSFAADWTGTTSTDWFTAGNWSPAGVPTSSDNAIIDTDTPSTTVVGAPGAQADRVSVGLDGTGTLTIENGGAVSNASGYVGHSLGSTGTVTVDGAGSTWTNSTTLSVGFSGTGALTIQNGGAVSSTLGSIGFHSSSNGTVTVDGAGSIWTDSGNLRVGDSGTGTLTIQNGGAVSDADGIIGFLSGSTGTVTVDGAGSTWTNTGTLSVGNSGTGTLTIQNGGAVSNTIGYIGAGPGSDGTVTVDGAGSTWTNSGELRVGNAGSGTLTIDNGGAVSNADGYVGHNLGSTGTVTVDGAGSTWTNTGTLSVGNSGTGTLTIQNGGAVSNTGGYIGAGPGADGTVTVDGAGSTWTNTGDLDVGLSGTGTLTIQNGGVVSNSVGFIGTYSGSTGTVTVDGAGSDWTTASDLLVGGFGTATLTIENGGAVSSAASSIAFGLGSTGTVTVDGAGSTWTNTGDLTVGESGTGTLTIQNGGLMNVNGPVVIARNADSTGTLNIGADLADEAAAPGALDGGSVAFGAGTGSLVFNHTDSNYIFTPAISGLGSMTVKAGTTILSGNAGGFGGTTTVNGGTLKVNSTLGGTLNVLGGTLGGDGTLLGALSVGSGGTLAPGNSIGAITVNNAVTFTNGSTYLVEVDSAGNSDELVSTDTVTIQSGASVHVTPETLGEDGSTYGLNTSYTIVTAANGVSGTFGSVTDDFAFLDALLGYDPNNVYLALHRNDLSFSGFGKTANQKAAADGAESLGAGHAVYDAILGLGAGQAPVAFDALSGEVHASTATALVEGSSFTRQSVLGRARTAFGGAASGDGQIAAVGVADAPEVALSDPERFALWMNAFGSWADWDGDGNAAGLDRSIGGVLVGGDALVAEGLRLGLFTGYSHTDLDVDARRSSASIDSAHLGAYATGEWGGLGLRLGGEYVWHDVETERSVAFAGFSDHLSADYDTGAAQVFGEVGYRMDLGTASIEPFVNAAYVHLDMDGFSERGGDAALQTRDQSTDATFTTLGLRAELPVALPVALGEASGRLHGMAGWRHAFDDTTPDTTLAFSGGDRFTVSGVPLAKDTAVLEAGFELDLGEKASLGISYDGEFGSDFSDQGVRAGFKLAF